MLCEFEAPRTPIDSKAQEIAQVITRNDSVGRHKVANVERLIQAKLTRLIECSPERDRCDERVCRERLLAEAAAFVHRLGRYAAQCEM
jgi:hypothetical protein